MPSHVDYWSDASFTSDASDDEDDDEVELYTPREMDYWAIEAYLETRGPPPIIEYVQNLGSVALRECVIGPLRTDIRSVVSGSDSHSWRNFWSNGPDMKQGRFSHDVWDAIGEFCFVLCECCFIDGGPARLEGDMTRVKSCMIRILAHGRFKSLRPV